MSKRKINRVGTSTLTVSLPSKWANSRGLKPGDDIEVTEDGAKLIISTSSQIVTPKKATIRLKAGQPLRKRHLNIAYRDGYDEIEIISEDLLDPPSVKRAVAELLGFELIDNQPKHIVVRNVATPLDTELDNVFRRLFLINVSMAKSLLDDMKSGNHDHPKETAELERTTNRFCFFCHRVLLKQDLKTRAQTLNMYRFASELEQMADHLEKICIALTKQKKKINSTVISAFEGCVNFLDKMYDDFYHPETERITSFRNVQDKLFEKVNALFNEQKLTGVEHELVALMFAFIYTIRDIGNDMYHL